MVQYLLGSRMEGGRKKGRALHGPKVTVTLALGSK